MAPSTTPRRRSRPRFPAIRCALAALALATPAGAVQGPEHGHLLPIRAVPAPLGAADICQRRPWACAESRGRTEAPDDSLAVAGRVNRAINAQVREIADLAQYGREELWDLPTARGGDCEDFALAKKKRLIEAGIPAGALLIATVLDRRREHHAVLVLRTRSQDVVLDNLTDRMLAWHETGYSFLRMQDPDAPRRWNAIAAGGIFGTGGI